MEKNYCEEHRKIIIHARKLENEKGFDLVCFSECLRCGEVSLKILSKKNV